MSKLTFGLSLVAVLATGCATETPLPPGPVMTFTSDAACTTSFDLANPVSLTPKEPAGIYTGNAVLTFETAPACFVDADGSKVFYKVFALPTEGRTASVSAGAVFQDARVFAPRVLTLAADGSVLRDFRVEDMRQRGRSISVLFRPRRSEKFVVVLGDPAQVSQRFYLIAPKTSSTPAAFSLPYSYEGKVFARAYFAKPAASSDE